MPVSKREQPILIYLGERPTADRRSLSSFDAAIRSRVTHEIVLSVTGMTTISISRRDFARLLGAGAAAAAVRPSLSFAKPTQTVTTPLAEGGIVRLSANENPYGPSP